MSNVEERLPVRKRNRLELFDYSSCAAYFITICTYNKKCLFWASKQPNSSPTNKGSVLTAVGQMKRHVSKAIGKPIWQKSFHDHVIRDRHDYEQIAKYIYENPIRWQYDCFYVSDEQAR